jgi:hypothetical protein
LITASGIIDLRQFVGGDVYVKVSANSPSMYQLSDGESISIDESEVPTRLSEHVYVAPFQHLEANYVVGERWEFIRIGKYAIKDVADVKELFGNYGVIYDIKIRIENPTADNRNVKIMFDPTAGPASGIFVIDGRIIGVKIVSPPHEFEITTVRVPAGAGMRQRERAPPQWPSSGIRNGARWDSVTKPASRSRNAIGSTRDCARWTDDVRRTRHQSYP